VLVGGALFCLLYLAELLGRPQIAWVSAGALAIVGICLLGFACAV
jgi:hypothetical protein